MELTTILNHCHHHRGFVDQHARFGLDKKTIEVAVRPRQGAAAICAGCHKPAPGYDQAVRGYYRFAMELGGLYGRNCPKKLLLDGAERAQAFYLDYGSKCDDKELAAIVHRLIEKKDSRAAIAVTVIGTVNTSVGKMTDRLGVRRKARMFGHLGVYPAQISVEAYRDIVVVDAPDFPSNMQPNRRF